MPQKPSMRDALQKSLGSEQKAVQDRFDKAEAVLALADSRRRAPVAPVEEAPPPAAKPRVKAVRAPRPKVLRRTFALTEDEYRLIFDLKKKCNLAGFEAAQSELVRAGLHQLATMDAAALEAALSRIEKLKRGRVGAESD